MIFVTRCEVYPPLEAMVVFCCCDKCPDQKPPGKGRLCHTGYCPPLREVRAGTSGRSLKEKPCRKEWRSLSYSLWLFGLVFLPIPGSPSRDVLPTVNWALTHQFQFLKTVSHTCAQAILTGQFFTWCSFFPGLLSWWQRLAIALSIQ